MTIELLFDTIETNISQFQKKNQFLNVNIYWNPLFNILKLTDIKVNNWKDIKNNTDINIIYNNYQNYIKKKNKINKFLTSSITNPKEKESVIEKLNNINDYYMYFNQYYINNNTGYININTHINNYLFKIVKIYSERECSILHILQLAFNIGLYSTLNRKKKWMSIKYFLTQENINIINSKLSKELENKLLDILCLMSSITLLPFGNIINLKGNVVYKIKDKKIDF
jgi:hypothetical protein